MRRGSLALVAILVLGSLTKLFLPPGTSSPGAPAATGATAHVATSSAPTPEDKASQSFDWYPTQIREKVRDFFGKETGEELDQYQRKAALPKGVKATPIDVDHVCKSVNSWCVPEDERSKIQFVIATVPDPVHSHLSLFFDRDIDSIQQGATGQNFLFDRAIMPWQYFDIRASQMTEEDKFLERVRESYPGLMIFRGQGGAAPLFVFVVGETPTAGINKEQFYKAVEMIHEMKREADVLGPAETSDFAVLGPSFSGSLYSLQNILTNYTDRYLKTAENKQTVIPVYAVVMAPGPIGEFQKKASAIHAKILIFMQDATVVQNALLTFAYARWYHDPDVAILNEDDTAYGGPSLSSSTRSKGTSYLTLYFPRGISQFRSAYSKDLQTQDQTAEANQPPRRNLRLDLQVTGSDDDNVAPYATAQTPLSQEAVMQTIVSELRRHDSKFVLIRATDPLDELFLARYLGSEDPDARLVVPTPDLLFARDEGGMLDGALGLNTYPVSPSELNPLCPSQYPDDSRLIFPAASSAGLYNATATLLLDEAHGRQMSPANITRSGASAATNSCPLSPNLWLTTVSHNTLYPVQVISPGQEPDPARNLLYPFYSVSKGLNASETAQRNGRLPAVWAMLCLLCVALLSNHVYRGRQRKVLGYWASAKQLGRVSQIAARKSWLLGLGAVTLMGLAVVFILSVTPWADFSHLPGSLGVVILLWLCALSFVSFTVCDFWNARMEPVVAGLFGAASLVMLFGGIVYAWRSAGELVLWQQRALDLASHVSPATPILLLLAAFYAWFWLALKSESLSDWRKPRLPITVPDSYSSLTEAAAEAILDVGNTGSRPPWVFRGGLIVVSLIAIRGVVLGPGGIPIRSLEGPLFDATYSVLFTLALFLLVTTLFRTVALWWKLQHLLTDLETPGMKQALLRLKGFEWNVIWNPLESMTFEARRLYLKEIHVVERLLESLGGKPDSEHPDVTDPVRLKLAGIIALRKRIRELGPFQCAAGSQDAKKVIIAFRSMQRRLAAAAGLLWRDFLDPSWKSLPADDAVESAKNQPKTPGKTTLRAEVNGGGEPYGIRTVTAEIESVDQRVPKTLPEKPLELAEEFVACVYATFITIVLLRIRWLVFSAVVMYTAVVFSSVSYPFQPAASLRNLSLMLFLLGAIVVGYVYEEMHHNPTLLNMTSTDPDKFDTAFWLKLASAGLLPLLGLLTSLFPQVGHLLYTIAAPILHATQ